MDVFIREELVAIQAVRAMDAGLVSPALEAQAQPLQHGLESHVVMVSLAEFSMEAMARKLIPPYADRLEGFRASTASLRNT